MAKKKKSRKSARRSRQQTATRARQPQVQEQAASQPVAAAAATKAKAPKKASTVSLTDFAKEYSYVYYDLRKMFLLAAAMFVLLIVVNMVLSYLLIA